MTSTPTFAMIMKGNARRGKEGKRKRKRPTKGKNKNELQARHSAEDRGTQTGTESIVNF